MHVGEGKVADILIRNLTIRLNEVLGLSYITLNRNAQDVEPVKDNRPVPGLIQEKLKIVWLAVKLDGQSHCARLEELCSRLIRVVEDIRISKGWRQCIVRCLSSHGDLGAQERKYLTWKKSLNEWVQHMACN